MYFTVTVPVAPLGELRHAEKAGTRSHKNEKATVHPFSKKSQKKPREHKIKRCMMTLTKNIKQTFSIFLLRENTTVAKKEERKNV